MSTQIRVVLSLAFVATWSACTDGGSTSVDLGEPDITHHFDLTGPRSGVGEACHATRGMQGTCKGDMAICLADGELGMPGGYCTQDCSATACPDDAQCIELAPGFSRCLAACNTDDDCRSPGYHCSDYQACVPIAGIYLGSEVEPGTNGGQACVQPAVAPPASSSFEPNQQLSTITGGETDLAIDEASGNIVVAWIQLYGTQSIGVIASHDFGVSWDPPIFLPQNKLVDGRDATSDPVVAVDSQGNFFLTWISFDFFGNFDVYVARSMDGGASFPDVFRVSPPFEWENGNFLDKPWIAVGPDDSIYVSWSASPTPMAGAMIRVARSVDHGQTWSVPVSTTPNQDTFHNLGEVAVAQDGTVYVVDVELNDTNLGSPLNAIALQRLTPDLALDGLRVVVSGAGQSIPFDETSLAVDGNSVYVAYTVGTPDGAWDVYVAASTDRGATFSSRVKVNDDPTCATHMHPAIAVDDDGLVHVAFYDNRYGSAAFMHAVSKAPASAGPLSFGANEFINDAPFDFTTERDGSSWLGDYAGIVAHGGHVYSSWTDNRVNDTAQIYFTRSGF